MCGILGAFAADKPLQNLPFTARDLDGMRHRGPNQQGWYVDEQALLAFRGLAILDLAGGAQPLFSEDEQIVAIVNGEIYNHRELRAQLKERHQFKTRVDGEVLVHLYEEKGEDFIHELSGMFGFALYDRRNRKFIHCLCYMPGTAHFTVIWPVEVTRNVQCLPRCPARRAVSPYVCRNRACVRVASYPKAAW